MKTKMKSAVKRYAVWLALLVWMLGIGSMTANAAINVSALGTQVGSALDSGTEATKEGGSLAWEWVSVIYKDQADQSCGYWTLLVEGSGSTLDYITTVYCGDETNTPWYADVTMRTGIHYAYVDEGITSIGNSFFAGMSSMLEIHLPNSLKTIGSGAFVGCSNLHKITIPSSVTSIAEDAFTQATGYLTIYCKSGSYAHQYAKAHGIKVYLTDKSVCENQGHSGGSAATCTKAQTCTRCGTVITAALGHNYAAATCEKPKTCTRCQTTTGSAKGHTWGSWQNWYSGWQIRSCSTCSGTETRSIVLVNDIEISGTSKKLLAGKSMQLTASVLPSNATNAKVKWKSSNTKYATVTSKGVVKAKAAGAGKTVTITATAKDGSKVKATYKIKIKGAVKKIRLKAAKKTVKAGKTVKITATVTVGKGGSKALKWTSGNKKYATVNAKGVVTTKKAGKGKTVTITAKAKDGSGKKATVTIKIK